MVSKVRVIGKAQNRTALGIMHAYMIIYPQATLEDLRKAFPNELAPDKGTAEIFIPAEEKGTTANWDGYFKNDDEVLTMGDGSKVSVVKMWTKPSFERTVEHAKQYGIEIEKFEKADKGFGKKGGFELKYLNGWTPPTPAPAQKKIKLWLWILLALLALAGILAAIFMNKEPEVQVVEKIVEKEKIVTVVDTVYVQQLEDIEKNFNAAQFEKGKADLSEEAKFVLHDLVKLMEKNADIKVKIVGHTSAEGDATANQKLSEDRAKAAVDFIVSRGIAQDRLQFEGKGSAEPIDSVNLEANRRTEFIVIE